MPLVWGGGPTPLLKTNLGGTAMLLIVFLISIAVLLLCIIKVKLNAFGALLV